MIGPLQTYMLKEIPAVVSVLFSFLQNILDRHLATQCIQSTLGIPKRNLTEKRNGFLVETL